MFVLVPSLFIALLIVSGNADVLQGPANYVFGSIQDVSLRLYLFEGLVVAVFLLIGLLAVHGVKANAVEELDPY